MRMIYYVQERIKFSGFTEKGLTQKTHTVQAVHFQVQ